MTRSTQAPTFGHLSAEIWRDNDKGGDARLVDIESLEFCSADHAGHYFLQGKLQPPDFNNSRPQTRSWRNRLFDWSVLALFLTIALLATVGIGTVVGWLRS